MVSISGCQRSSTAVVNFPDPGLEAAIRDAIAKPTGDIQKADLEALSFIDGSERSISSLAGIQYCVNLTGLVLTSNKIVDISALSGLTSLMHLYLSGNEIVDISALSGLTNLSSLDLDRNKIVDIQALVDNAGLGTEVWVGLRHNDLDRTPGSPSMLDIETLQGRGVRIFHVPQN